MSRMIFITLSAEIPDDIIFTEDQAAELLFNLEDQLAQANLDLDDSDYDIMD